MNLGIQDLTRGPSEPSVSHGSPQKTPTLATRRGAGLVPESGGPGSPRLTMASAQEALAFGGFFRMNLSG